LPNFSQIDWGTEIKPLKDVSKWIGEGNMAMRPAVFDAVGGFPVSLGRRKNSLMGHEGNALREKLEKMGYVTWYNGKQKVEHIVFEARITSRGWVRKRAFWGGVSEALCHLHSGEVQRKGRFLFAARYFKLVCSTGVLRLFIGADPDGILLEAQCEALFKLGYSAGLSFFGGRLY